MKLRREIMKLGAVCKVIAGQSPRGNAYNDKGLGVEFHQGKKAFGKYVIQPSGVWTTEITKMAEAGDILMSVRAPVGPTNFTDRSVCIGRGLAAIRCSELVLPQYILYALKNIESKIVGKDGAVFNSISKDMIEDLPVPKLPLSEQQRIVALLDAEFAKIDALKANAEKNLQNAKDLFQAALKKELEPKEGWEKTTLQDICTHIVDCPHTTPIKSQSKTEYPCIRTSELKNGEISWETMQYVEKSEYLKRVSRLVPQENDIVYGREGTFGDAILIPNYYHFCLGQRTMLFRPNQELVIPRFLLLYVISPYVYDQAKAKNTGCGVGHVNVRDIKEFSINLPQINDQQTIVARLDVLNEKCKTLQANYEKTLSLCDDLKQALLRKAFNGEL